MQLNYNKSKILVFSKSWNQFQWNLNGHKIEQVKGYKYLGVLFHYKDSWSPHRKMVINVARFTGQAILHFYYNFDNCYVLVALQVFKSKIIPQILYGISICLNAMNRSIEWIQSQFLHKVLGLSSCVPYLVLCLETGFSSLETMAWLRSFQFWLKIVYNSDPDSLLYQLLLDSKPPFGSTAIKTN